MVQQRFQQTYSLFNFQGCFVFSLQWDPRGTLIKGKTNKKIKQAKKKMVQTLGKSDIHFYLSNILFKGVLFSVHSFPLKKKKKKSYIEPVKFQMSTLILKNKLSGNRQECFPLTEIESFLAFIDIYLYIFFNCHFHVPLCFGSSQLLES